MKQNNKYYTLQQKQKHSNYDFSMKTVATATRERAAITTSLHISLYVISMLVCLEQLTMALLSLQAQPI